MIQNYKGGALEKPPNPKDYIYNDIKEIMGVGEVDWTKGYDVEQEIKHRLKRERQNGSQSCVAQSISKYGEVLNFVETNNFIDFSSKRIYSNIYLPQGGGAYTVDGCKFVVDNGFLFEDLDESYENGNPPSESYMRKKKELNKQEINLEKIYQPKMYFFVGYKMEDFAIAIRDNHGMLVGVTGSNEGWIGADARPPQTGEREWGHLMYGIGYGIKNGKKYIKVLNSWGEHYGDDGCNYIYEDYFQSDKIHRGIVLVDKENLKLYRLIKEKGKPAVYLHDMVNNEYYGLADGEGIAGGDMLKSFSGDYGNAGIISINKINPERIVGEIKPKKFDK